MNIGTGVGTLLLCENRHLMIEPEASAGGIRMNGERSSDIT